MAKYEAIIVGAGHAGIEAAFALAHKKHKVALVSLDINKIAMMPCNPAIGGPAKGILTREIDALGGMQGLFADQAMIQIKMLNEGRGPAVRALRAQIDHEKYSQIVKEAIIKHKYIDFIEGQVDQINVDQQKVKSVTLINKTILEAKIIIITTGTYMDASILQGESMTKAGPDGQKTSTKISDSLKKLGISMQRLKTGTPPRVYSDSIDFSQVKQEILAPTKFTFSHRFTQEKIQQVACYLTYTNEATHNIIRQNLTKSSMYSGAINGVGPRYCPSIEDKVVRFKDKERHQIFYEPETISCETIYVQGFSTSMPVDVQELMLKTLPGMAHARVKKWGYAIEYDAIDPLELQASLELKTIDGLFLAGQVNGTSGYEEAASQGLMAGINAALKLENHKPLIIRRDQGYIGVLIDDLITKGTNEPYRMLTSRAEYRLLLRNDNADQRLTHLGYKVGLISESQYQSVEDKYAKIAQKKIEFSQTFLSANAPLAKKYNINSGPSLWQVLARPDVDYRDVSTFKFIYELWVQARLEGYIKKQATEAQKMKRLEYLKIPEKINYNHVVNLATEAREKFMKIRPQTIGQATRISGINPADIQMLMFYLNLLHKQKDYEN